MLTLFAVRASVVSLFRVPVTEQVFVAVVFVVSIRGGDAYCFDESASVVTSSFGVAVATSTSFSETVFAPDGIVGTPVLGTDESGIRSAPGVRRRF